MNYIFISPHFPSNFANFVQKLNEKGVKVLGIGDANYYTLSDSLRRNLTEYYKVENMQDYKEMFRAVAYLSYKHGKIDRLESHNEFWMEQDAKLRTDFNIPGFKNEDMPHVKYKSEMKKVYESIGINVAEGHIVDDYDGVHAFIQKVGYPIIIKPDMGVGANDTYRIDDENALRRFFEVKSDYRYLCEQFLDGDIVTYDGLTDIDGNIVFTSSFAYTDDVLSMVMNCDDFIYYSEKEVPEDLEKLGRACVEAFHVKERFFHMEFFRMKDGTLYGLEVNLRPPGGVSMDMWNFASDIDLYDIYAEVVLGGYVEAKYVHPYYCMFYGRQDIKNYVMSNEEFLTKYGINVVMYKKMEGVFRQMGDDCFVVRTPNRDMLFEMMEKLSAQY